MKEWLTLHSLSIFAAVPSPDDLGLPKVQADNSNVKNLLSVIFGTAAAAAVLVIVLAGFRLATSEAEPENISRGKRAIIYALIGLAVAVSAEIIVLTVVDGIGK